MVKFLLNVWNCLNQKIIYENPWITVYEDQVQLPNGQTTLYGVVEAKSDFVGVVPLIDPTTVVLVRQYRYIQNEVTWEITSGAIDENETPEQAAQRELSEEIGYHAEALELVSIMRSNKSLMRDKGYIFLARGLTPCKGEPDSTEEFETALTPLDKALDMVKRHEITDCVSIIGLLIAGTQSQRC
ncbi:MAG: NUDIX domain-containing protein [Candidatus Hermodarchaeia archaeon]